MSIEPDVSMTNVMFAGGRSASATVAVSTAMRTSAVPSSACGAARRLDADPDGTVGRCRVVVVERVDPLLDADRRRVRGSAAGELGQGGAVGAGVDVEGERRLGVVGGRHERRVAAVDEHVVLGGVGPGWLRRVGAGRAGHRRHRRGHRAAGRHVRRRLAVVVDVAAGVDVGAPARGRLVAAAPGEGDGQQAGGEGGDHSVAHGRSDVPDGATRFPVESKTVITVVTDYADRVERNHRGTSHRHRHRRVSGPRPRPRPFARRRRAGTSSPTAGIRSRCGRTAGRHRRGRRHPRRRHRRRASGRPRRRRRRDRSTWSSTTPAGSARRRCRRSPTTRSAPSPTCSSSTSSRRSG